MNRAGNPSSPPSRGNPAQLYVRAVRGWFANWRIALAIVTQLVFYGGPWLEWNGRQAILFHLVERKFYLFGLILWPQDVIYLAVLLIVSAYALFLVTAIAGRLFCGYACPQTVYTEIFMWIENWIEGNRNARMKLDREPVAGHLLRVKAAKHALWVLLSLWTGFTLVGYFTPMDELLEEARGLAFGPWEAFWMLFYGGFTYLMAGLLREEVCKHMCPYARFQGVMFDPDTLVISYDAERGEPRGPRRKGSDFKAQGLGLCVDCGICVQACPTGMDIRNGLQYECIGCAACIDACDQVMDRMGYPGGLVRYSTENAASQHLSHREILAHVLRPRIVVYGAILLAIIGTAGWFLAHRMPLKVDVIRDRSTLVRHTEDGGVENVYVLRFMNTDEKFHRYRIRVAGLEGIGVVGAREVEVSPTSIKEVPVAVHATPDLRRSGSNRILFDITAEDDRIRAREKAAFLLP
ncbi:MAG TPA: cytochrome c oxidase accessory protein CcoG [Rhodocyclaceae bacterium]|nr:cytochrome c oxidase accessory protein CcoG [Rhodocyclaceae bacterium]